MEILSKYFKNLSKNQINQFKELDSLYRYWNAQINVISRKDIAALYEKHVLHSLGIAKVQQFKPNAQILDIGTGGGFPGIPLAILFPKTQFLLVDSIGKKIKVVQAVADALQLNNVEAKHIRAEKVSGKFDFIISRAVTNMDAFVRLTRNKIKKEQNHKLKNGILYLKGGDLTDELKNYSKAKIYNLSDFFEGNFFETKKVVYLKSSR
ncbi:MAG: 16S rRNA (guanine(527)-N(7))-methyltransferase RsmG [Lutibacter sp.]